MTKLVIVESPAKARTIEKYLGKDFKVAASVGHVVDLPRKELGVDVDHDFKPSYEVMPEKRKAVSSLEKAATDANEIYLAPDPDREGEAIAWHIARLLEKSGKPMRRVLINEITRDAVLKALQEAGELDQDRFEAQQARRILDRLVGYLISPLISRKFRSSLSAGRVQSVALRLVVDRENEIRSFQSREYWSIEALLEAKEPPEFKARLAAIEGKTLEAPGDRFDQAKHVFIPDQAAARAIVESLSGRPFVVKDVVRQERRRNPQPPFITSTLQQDAARRLGFSAKKTMTLAQRLYEGQDVGEGAVGLITYMRTDSPRVSDQALDMVRGYIKDTYGNQFLPKKPRVYKSRKSAQEAHEAVRPTSLARAPQATKAFLETDMQKLYELIFIRFVASQMKPAVYDQTTVEMPVDKYLFRASGRVIKFKGFLAVYEEATEDDKEDGDELPLPELKSGDRLSVKEIIPEQHFTKPPPRFTEASLVRELEERGIGRPSTYAQILSTIQDREYVTKDKKRFMPTPLGEMITSILVAAFPDILEEGFTAQMEQDLDRIEEGKENWVKLLHRFYKPFSNRLSQAGKIIDSMRQGIPTDLNCPHCGKELVIKWSAKGEFLGCSGYPDCTYTTDFERDEAGNIIAREKQKVELSIPCPECGKALQIRKGRRGEFLGCSGFPKCKFTSDFSRDENGEIKLVKRQKAKAGSKKPEPQPLPDEPPCEKCGSPMVMREGRYGPFIACSGYPKCKNIRKKADKKKQGSKKASAPKKSAPSK